MRTTVHKVLSIDRLNESVSESVSDEPKQPKVTVCSGNSQINFGHKSYGDWPHVRPKSSLIAAIILLFFQL